ncbi:LysR family transcriptional regulator [Halotalea alkalilenta]|uniref:LysR family transcriptional regulator n=1 Tax=Halotalea alkalilenta TaxID=376489 RepID=UPI0004840BCD|nr:LysR family transcriptional regulator [Halotalea alkalilenta]
MNGLDLNQLHTFIDVIELGSFSAAAEHRGISQPAVSAQVRQLEHRLGVRLIDRSGRRAQATAAGQELLIHARRIAQEVASTLETLQPHREGTQGRIRLGTGATACIHLLPPLLKRLKQRMPGLDITVRAGNTQELLKQLESNSLDLALVTLPAAGRSLEVIELYQDEMVAVLPLSEADGLEALEATRFLSQPLILYESAGHTRHLVDRWFAAAGERPKPSMELGSVEAIKRLVGAGLGWAILPRLALPPEGRDAEIEGLPLSPPLVRSLGLVMRRDKRSSRALYETVEALLSLRTS